MGGDGVVTSFMSEGARLLKHQNLEHHACIRQALIMKRRCLKQEQLQHEICSIERKLKSAKDDRIVRKLKLEKIGLEQRLYTMKFNQQRQRKLRAKRKLEFECRNQFCELSKKSLDSSLSDDCSSGTKENRDIEVLFKVVTAEVNEFECFVRSHASLLLQDLNAFVKLQLLRDDFVECTSKFGRAYATSSLLFKLKTFLM
jgi:hypothetical protein